MAQLQEMSDEEIFYLKSRAISDRDARALLSRGYALETVSRIRNEKVKEEISSLISEYLRNQGVRMSSNDDLYQKIILEL